MDKDPHKHDQEAARLLQNGCVDEEANPLQGPASIDNLQSCESTGLAGVARNCTEYLLFLPGFAGAYRMAAAERLSMTARG